MYIYISTKNPFKQDAFHCRLIALKTFSYRSIHSAIKNSSGTSKEINLKGLLSRW